MVTRPWNRIKSKTAIRHATSTAAAPPHRTRMIGGACGRRIDRAFLY